ncbi:peptidoglycan editing factor PgeF [Roseburia sp. AM16-25]|uniref:peptidoglycan editing factor PgeF n=1 Tax=Roseburia sp. AM16-25 TaxID=2292065 RepID=UPI000E47F501|nr:peptidoglycan editing factor PgeF [Roseburia sp. AM16-25]MDY3872795.1 peptidoglycan editing factor PgeF [Roseburia lenta]RHO32273.1 peptidoglycan editing factor PgeF [Roseburia sp. AM16-25]
MIEKRNYRSEEGYVLPYLSFSSYEALPYIRHMFTTREGGVSKDIYESLNLSFTRGDDETAVLENYRRVAQALGTSIDHIVTSDQTHTTNVRPVGKEDLGKGITRPRDYKDVDGMITDQPGVLLATFYADCVPLYFVDPVHKAIGLSHSGWRGTVGRMGQATVEAMERSFGSQPKDLLCAIGPSICQDCYEVSRDVAEAFIFAFPTHEKEILQAGALGKYQLDLWKANEIVLTEAGVLKEHIDLAGLCTCCNSSILFSHRASKGKRGNLGAFLMLTE